MCLARRLNQCHSDRLRVSVISISLVRTCFGYRASDFGFSVQEDAIVQVDDAREIVLRRTARPGPLAPTVTSFGPT